MNKIIGLICCVVLMSSCVSYQVQRPYYDTEQELNEIISSKSIILIVDSFKYGAKPPKKVSNNYFANRFRNESLIYRSINSPDDVFPSNGHPKAIKDFMLIDGIISGVIIEIPEYTAYPEENGIVEVNKNPSYYNYFEKGQALNTTFPKRKFRDAREVVCLFTSDELEYGSFSMPVQKIESRYGGKVVTYILDQKMTKLRNVIILGPIAAFAVIRFISNASVWGGV